MTQLFHDNRAMQTVVCTDASVIDHVMIIWQCKPWPCFAVQPDSGSAGPHDDDDDIAPRRQRKAHKSASLCSQQQRTKPTNVAKTMSLWAPTTVDSTQTPLMQRNKTH